MNSIRRRIEWERQNLIDSCNGVEIPDICKRDIPHEMPEDFMACTDKIRIGATKALDAFESDENYIWLQAHKTEITPKESKRICLENVLWYAEGLEQAITEDDLISMRRKCNFEHYLDSFFRCRCDMEKIFSERAVELQTSLFSAGAPQADVIFHEGEDESESDELEITM